MSKTSLYMGKERCLWGELSRLVSCLFELPEQLPFSSAAIASRTRTGPENSRDSARTTDSGPVACGLSDSTPENKPSASLQPSDEDENSDHKTNTS